MTAAKPQPISVNIGAELEHLALNGGSRAAVAARAQRILDSCDKLAAVDGVGASILRANLFALMGDKVKCEYWLKNVETLRQPAEASKARAWCLLLLGCVSEAYPSLVEYSKSFGTAIAQIAGCGLFRQADELLTRTKLGIDAQLRKDIEQASGILDQLNLEDAKICELMDVTLGFLCEKGLIWLGSHPDFRFLSERAGGPLIAMTYRIAVPYEEAARLNAELVERLVEANLDTLGMVVGLSGQEEKVRPKLARVPVIAQ